MTTSIRRALTCATSYDPTTFLVGVAAWAILTAISLLLPGSAFDASPVYAVARSWWVSEDQWGVILLIDGLALLASIATGSFVVTPASRRALVPWRAGTAILSGFVFFTWGGLLLAGAAGLANGWNAIFSHGFFSAAGAWTLFAGVGCWVAAEQWVQQGIK